MGARANVALLLLTAAAATDRHESGTPIYDLANHAWGYHEDSKKDATFLLAFILPSLFYSCTLYVFTRRFAFL